MIGFLHGTVKEKYGEQAIVEAGGVGYEVTLPLHAWAGLVVGNAAELYIYHHIREDISALYGFGSRSGKTFFTKLIGISGVGPKVAMAVLSAASLERLQAAISEGDVSVFQGVSGVGKKTAERIMIELHGKVELGAVSAHDTVYQALIGLGYSSQQASAASSKVPEGIIDEQERIKQALKLL